MIKPKVLAVAIGALLVAGCFGPTELESEQEVVARLEQTFPTLRDLRIGVYFRNDDCEYFAYQGGHYTSKPEDQWCRVFVDAEHFMDPPEPAPFDQQARNDLEKMKAAFAAVGLAPADSVNLAFTLGIDESTNAFSFDRCRTFYYRTVFEDGPDPDSVTTILNADWVVTDYCR